jgi:hypothetical protein
MQNGNGTGLKRHEVPVTGGIGNITSWNLTCKVRGCHGSDYEECRLLGYKNQVRTSQETHYVSTTEPSQLMLCKI